MKLAIAALLFCTASASFAAKRITVEQLQAIVTSGQSGGMDDAKIARSLAGVALTERITESTLTGLLVRAAGPRTKDVLQILADLSAFLDPPAAARMASDAPSAAEQAEILARAGAYTVRYVRTLPDFICVRATRRFDDDRDLKAKRPEVWDSLRLRDMFAGELSFSNGSESYVDQASPGSATGDGRSSSKGLTSFGEFGSMIGALFIGDSAPQIGWGYWETVNGARLAVFRYSVSAAHSRYSVSFGLAGSYGFVSVASAYKGEIYVDPVSGAILRITRRAFDLPPSFPTRGVDTVVDYRAVPIGGESYLCPIRSVTFTESTVRNTAAGSQQVRFLNEIRFLRYRKFGTASKLLTGEPPETAALQTTEARAPQEPDPWLELEPSDERAEPTPLLEPAEPALPGLTIRTTTRLVEVPVIVRDKHGDPINGLKKEEFAIYDNGKPQDVRLFAVDRSTAPSSVQPSPAPPLPPEAPHRIYSNREEESLAPTHSTVILVDQMNTAWADLAYARLEIIKFLRKLPPGEPVGIYIMNLGAGPFTILRDVTRDSGSLAKLLSSDRHRNVLTPASAGSRQPSDAALASWIDGSAANSIKPAGSGVNVTNWWALTAVAKHLAGIPGRKNVVWVSGGFPQVQFPQPKGLHTGMQGGGESSSEYDDMVKTTRAFNDANAALYSVDAAGLQTGYANASTEVPRDSTGLRLYNPDWVKAIARPATEGIHANQSGMVELAARTGGRAFLNTNDLTGAIQTAFEDSRGSYRLGFYPPARNDGQYHEIRVKLVERPDARLRYRRGFFDALSALDPKSQLRDAILSPINALGIPLTAELSPASGGYELRLSVGIAAVSADSRGNRQLQVVLMQMDEDGAQLERLEQTLGLQLKKETYEAMLQSGFPYRHSFAPKSKAAALRVVVRDPRSGTVGSLTIPMSGPPD
jgi:VWFA-related protein